MPSSVFSTMSRRPYGASQTPTRIMTLDTLHVDQPPQGWCLPESTALMSSRRPARCLPSTVVKVLHVTAVCVGAEVQSVVCFSGVFHV